MITIPHTNGVISEENKELIPTTFVARHSNGSEWIYFETHEEYEVYKLEHFPAEQPEEEL